MHINYLMRQEVTRLLLLLTQSTMQSLWCTVPLFFLPRGFCEILKSRDLKVSVAIYSSLVVTLMRQAFDCAIWNCHSNAFPCKLSQISTFWTEVISITELARNSTVCLGSIVIWIWPFSSNLR